MPAPLPPGYADVVRSHHPRTTGYIVATRGDCLRIRDEEIRRVKRNLRPLEPPALDRLQPSGSWMLAALLCPGDDTRWIAVWAKELRPSDRDRVRLYYNRGIDLGSALRAWVVAGLGPPMASEVRDFASFHKVFGKHLNDRVWLDHA